MLNEISKSNGQLEICRIKNGFNRILSENDSNDSGYRDLKVNVLYKSKNKRTKMIGEIQFLLIPFLKSKKKSHKLYAIMRESIYYDMIVNGDKYLNNNNNNNNSPNKNKNISNMKTKLEIQAGFGMYPFLYENIYNAIVSEELNLLAVIREQSKQVYLTLVELNSRDEARDIRIKQWDSEFSFDDSIEFYNNGLNLAFTKLNGNIIYNYNDKTKTTKKMLTIKRGNYNIKSFKIDKFNRILIHCQPHKSTYNDNLFQLRSMTSLKKILCEICILSTMYIFPLSIDESISKQFACAVSGSNDGKFYLINFNEKRSFECESEFVRKACCSLFFGEKYIAIGGSRNHMIKNERYKASDGLIEIWDKISRSPIRVLEGFDSRVTVLGHSGSMLYGCSFNGELIMFDTSNDQFKQYKSNMTLYRDATVHISENGKYLTVAGAGCKVFEI